MDKLIETLRTYDCDVNRYVKKLEFPLPKNELMNFINLLPGKNILDAGCGAGRDSKFFYDQKLNIIGIDLSENMLNYAKNRTRANFFLMDIRKTSFLDEFFDGIWCYNNFLHLDHSDLETTINEFKRILKNNGILYVATKLGEGEISKKSEKGTKHFFLYTENYLKDVFKEAGFKISSVTNYKQRNEDFIDIVLIK